MGTLRDIERRYPCAEGNRRTWAAFSPSGGPAAFKPTQARAALHSVWVVIESEAFAAMHSWHDFRATLATALAAAEQSHTFIQAAVCWASPASVALYGQQQPEAMADAADLATSIDASRHAHVETPHVCDDTVVDELEACMAHLSAEPDGHAPTKAAIAKRPGAPPKAKPAKKKKATPAPTVRASTPAPSTSTSTATYDVGAPLGSRTRQSHARRPSPAPPATPKKGAAQKEKDSVPLSPAPRRSPRLLPPVCDGQRGGAAA
jgi:hypothetical protein